MKALAMSLKERSCDLYNRLREEFAELPIEPTAPLADQTDFNVLMFTVAKVVRLGNVTPDPMPEIVKDEGFPVRDESEIVPSFVAGDAIWKYPHRTYTVCPVDTTEKMNGLASSIVARYIVKNSCSHSLLGEARPKSHKEMERMLETNILKLLNEDNKEVSEMEKEFSKKSWNTEQLPIESGFKTVKAVVVNLANYACELTKKFCDVWGFTDVAVESPINVMATMATHILETANRLMKLTGAPYATETLWKATKVVLRGGYFGSLACKPRTTEESVSRYIKNYLFRHPEVETVEEVVREDAPSKTVDKELEDGYAKWMDYQLAILESEAKEAGKDSPAELFPEAPKEEPKEEPKAEPKAEPKEEKPKKEKKPKEKTEKQKEKEAKELQKKEAYVKECIELGLTRDDMLSDELKEIYDRVKAQMDAEKVEVKVEAPKEEPPEEPKVEAPKEEPPEEEGNDTPAPEPEFDAKAVLASHSWAGFVKFAKSKHWVVTKTHRLLYRLFKWNLMRPRHKLNIMLTGPKGTGKTASLDHMSLYFFGKVTDAITAPDSKEELNGFVDAMGRVVVTPFISALGTPGVSLIDEGDRADQYAIVSLNTGIANGRFKTPAGDVVPDKYRMFAVCTNTIGTGATDAYVAKRMDDSCIDRFIVAYIDHDLETFEAACEVDFRDEDGNGTPDADSYAIPDSHYKGWLKEPEPEFLDHLSFRDSLPDVLYQWNRDCILNGNVRACGSIRSMQQMLMLSCMGFSDSECMMHGLVKYRMSPDDIRESRERLCKKVRSGEKNRWMTALLGLTETEELYYC